MNPDWLPAPLVLNGSSMKDDYDKLHHIFTETIINAGLTIEGSAVIIDRHPDHAMPQYEAGFMHLVTRSNGSGIRIIDYDRAVKIHWVAAIIKHYKARGVCTFWRRGPKGETLHLWMPDQDYVVILKWTSKSQTKKIIVTAYSIDARNRKVFRKYYEQATEVISDGSGKES